MTPSRQPSATSARRLRVAFVEPHLRRYGGIRRMVEFGNRLVGSGFDVVFVLPDEVVASEGASCSWMGCVVPVVPLSVAVSEAWDVVVFNHEPQWVELERFGRARSRVWYALHFGSCYGKEGSWDALRVPVDVQFANSGWTAWTCGGATC